DRRLAHLRARARHRRRRRRARAASLLHSSRRHAEGLDAACGAHRVPPRRATRRWARGGDGDSGARRHLSEPTLRSAVHARASREQARGHERGDVVITAREVSLPTYAVTIAPGAIDTIGDIVARCAPAHRIAIITDSNVGPAYADRVREQLARDARVSVLT